jgi:hypothetical protein
VEVPDQSGKRIPRASEEPFQDLIRFSFKFLDDETEDFLPSKSETRDHYLATLMGRLRTVSTYKIGEFLGNRSMQKGIDAHPIDWTDPRVKNHEDGFSRVPKADEQARDAANNYAWQFSLTKNEYGRVHGFILGSTFYVVWLDPEHLLYPGDAKRK